MTTQPMSSLEGRGFQEFCKSLFTDYCNFSEVIEDPEIMSSGESKKTPDFELHDVLGFLCYSDSLALEDQSKSKANRMVSKLWDSLLETDITSKYFRIRLEPESRLGWEMFDNTPSWKELYKVCLRLIEKFESLEEWERIYKFRDWSPEYFEWGLRDYESRLEWLKLRGCSENPELEGSLRSSHKGIIQVLDNPHWVKWPVHNKWGNAKILVALEPLESDSRFFGKERSAKLVFGFGPFGSVHHGGIQKSLPKKIRRKSSKYATPDEPILLMLHSRAFGFRSDLKAGLYGPKGVWRNPSHGRRVWGVWGFLNVRYPLEREDVISSGCMFLSPWLEHTEEFFLRAKNVGVLDYGFVYCQNPGEIDLKTVFVPPIGEGRNEEDLVWGKKSLQASSMKEAIRLLIDKRQNRKRGGGVLKATSPASELFSKH